MLSSINYVVYVIIIAAGALAFVVLYNLANINITERTRELATIKVLGFYDGEVTAYVCRENALLTVLGILLGLVGGYFLHQYVAVSYTHLLGEKGLMAVRYFADWNRSGCLPWPRTCRIWC